jgi:hypothetical protein
MKRTFPGISLWLVLVAWVRAANPAMPNIPSTVFNVTNYGAIGDGITDNTISIQNAINAASAAGGGIVEIPAGTFLSGPLTPLSNINLQVDTNAILQMLPLGTYPGGTTNAQPLLYCATGHDIEISGQGTIDGQGAAWWTAYDANNSINRPMIIDLYNVSRLYIHDVTFQNPPYHHCGIRGNSGDITVSNLTVNTSSSSPNTDGLNFVGTNAVIENCHISDGDDNIALGATGPINDLLITNCTFGSGHGVSIGSSISVIITNLVVNNCTFNGTQNGIRIKSDDSLGGLVDGATYCNLGMTNVEFPIVIYSYYSETGTPRNISPAYAAAQPLAAVNSLTPFYRDITFSNITATSVSGYPIGIIWARTEAPATNIVFNRVNLTGNRSFDLYNVSGAQFIDCNLNPSATSNTFALFNAQVIVTNSAPTNTLFTFDGLTTNGYGNSLAFYNAAGALQNTNVLGNGPLTLAASTFTVSNNLTLFPTTLVNFTLGTNATTLAVAGNLALGGTSDIFAGGGFTNGTYTLMTYTGTLSGNLPVLGSTPADYSYAFDTSTTGQVNLVVATAVTPPPAPTGLTATAENAQVSLNWTASAGASGYIIERSLTNNGPYLSIATNAATSYVDTGLINGTTYYYVVAATNSIGESAISGQASATPQISAPTGLTASAGDGEVLLSWTASAGATGYIIERSTTNNGPYTSIATNATTTYVDDSVTNRTTYYYVVAAVAPGTQSVNSSQVSVTPMGTSVAGLFLYEGFNYTNTINLTNNGGAGWGYPWTDKGSLTVINTNSLSYTDANGNVLSTSGGGITDSNTSSTVTLEPERLLGNATTVTLGTLAATNSNTLWISYLWQGNNTGGQGTGNNSYRQATLMLMSAATTAGGGTERLDLGMPNISNGSISPNFSLWDANVIAGGTTLSSTAPLQSTVAANTGSVLFVLIQMTIDNSTTTADTINVWLNPPLGVGVGSLGTPNLTFSGQDLSAVNAIRFQSSAVNSTYNVGGQQTVDEFRLGTSLASVTPTVLISNTPPVLAAISNYVINVGVNLSITNSATDTNVPAQTLTFSLPIAPTNATLDANSGILNWRPLVTQANSTNPFAVVVTDNGTPSLSATQNFSVTVNPLVLPTITAPTLTSGQVGISISGQVGPDYAVEGSSNLLDWDILLITNPATMPFSWSTNAGTNPVQFYRIKVGPPLP